MMNSEKLGLIKTIQANYYEILDYYFGDLYADYLSSGKTCRQYVYQYVNKQKSIILLNGENNHTTKVLEFCKNITEFWNANIQQLNDSLHLFGKIGLFGTIENNDFFHYENTIKQNAVFFDIVALNDPFYQYEQLSKTIRFYRGNVFLFYASVISIFSLRQYIFETEDIMAIIIPTNALVGNQEKEQILTKAHESALNIARQLFGISYDNDCLFESIKVLKGLKDDDIAKIFKENDILISLKDAQNYEQYAMTVEERRTLLELSRDQYGNANWDFIRCVINYSAIEHILTDTLYIHAIHTEAAKNANMSPIYNIFEWYPNKYYYRNIPVSNSPIEYKYVCAIQRNDKLAQLVRMDIDTLIKFRSKTESEKFRLLFYKATNDIIKTPDRFDEIANMVFCRLKETLHDIEVEHQEHKKSEKLSSIFGLSKAAGGFVPVVSQVLSVTDFGKALYDIYNVFTKNRDDVINHLVNNSDNIFSD